MSTASLMAVRIFSWRAVRPWAPAGPSGSSDTLEDLASAGFFALMGKGSHRIGNNSNICSNYFQGYLVWDCLCLGDE